MIGKKIAIYREEKNMSQEDLAKALDVSLDKVISFENEEEGITVSILLKMSEIFNVSIDELCGNKRSSSIREHISTATTIYNKDILTKTSYYQNRKNFIFIFFGILMCVIGLVAVVIGNCVTLYNVLIPVILIMLFFYALISRIIRINKRVIQLTTCEDKGTYHFYKDHIECVVAGKNGTVNFSYLYDDAAEKDIFRNYLYLRFENRFIVVDLDKLQAKDKVLKALDIDESKSRPVTKRNRLLVIFVILSILSFVLPFLLAAIIYRFHISPKLPLLSAEHFWVCYLFIPIPIFSIVIGFVYRKKKQKDQQQMAVVNIVIGIIALLILIGFGAISSDVRKDNIHNFSYMETIDQMVPIDFPNDGNISISYHELDGIQSIADVIFKGEEVELFNKGLASDDKWKTSLSFLPVDVLNNYYIVQITDFDYYCLFDVSDGIFNIVNDEQGVHQYILMSYKPGENELFIIMFMY